MIGFPAPPPHIAAARRWSVGRVVTVVGIAASAALVGSLLVATAIVAALGCGAVDPTDPINYSTATVINDTARPVTIGDCLGDYCGSVEPPPVIAPNGSAVVDGACGATGKRMTTWKLTDTDGQVLGYIDIDTPRSKHDLVFTVSHASPDRLTPTIPQ